MVHLLLQWAYLNKVTAGEQIVKHVENLKARALWRREKAIESLERDLARSRSKTSKEGCQEKIRKLREAQDQVSQKQEAIDEFVEKQYATQIKLF